MFYIKHCLTGTWLHGLKLVCCNIAKTSVLWCFIICNKSQHRRTQLIFRFILCAKKTWKHFQYFLIFFKVLNHASNLLHGTPTRAASPSNELKLALSSPSGRKFLFTHKSNDLLYIQGCNFPSVTNACSPRHLSWPSLISFLNEGDDLVKLTHLSSCDRRRMLSAIQSTEIALKSRLGSAVLTRSCR